MKPFAIVPPQCYNRKLGLSIAACLSLLICLACHKKTVNDEKKEPETPTPVTRVVKIDTLADSLFIPWGLAYLPNGDLLFTERTGNVNLLSKGASHFIRIGTRPSIQDGEAGLLGVAVDPEFTSNHFVYFYETVDSNRVARLTLMNGVLGSETVIVKGIPKAQVHDGGALRFGKDRYLYMGTGDAQKPNNAQDLNSKSGKILRVTRDGDPAPGNPFNSLVWSFGHRNVQGLCWSPAGNMFSTEHGPSIEINGWCCHDELNRIEKGENHGWPVYLGGTETGTMVPPLLHSGDDTWAPSGCSFLGPNGFWPNTIVIACLRGQKLLQIRLNAAENAFFSQSDTLFEAYGRIRNVIEAPDGSLVFSTSNSYGSMNPGVDKILRLYKQEK